MLASHGEQFAIQVDVSQLHVEEHAVVPTVSAGHHGAPMLVRQPCARLAARFSGKDVVSPFLWLALLGACTMHANKALSLGAALLERVPQLANGLRNPMFRRFLSVFGIYSQHAANVVTLAVESPSRMFSTIAALDILAGKKKKKKKMMIMVVVVAMLVGLTLCFFPLSFRPVLLLFLLFSSLFVFLLVIYFLFFVFSGIDIAGTLWDRMPSSMINDVCHFAVLRLSAMALPAAGEGALLRRTRQALHLGISGVNTVASVLGAMTVLLPVPQLARAAMLVRALAYPYLRLAEGMAATYRRYWRERVVAVLGDVPECTRALFQSPVMHSSASSTLLTPGFV